MSLVREIRGAEGLSQRDLEEITGYSMRTIQRKEAMHLPEPDFMAHIIARTGTDAEYVAEEYGERAKQHVLALVRQKISPLH